MANNILHATIMQKNTGGGKNIIYPKTVTKNIIDGDSTLEQTLNTLKSSDMSNKTTEFTEAKTRQNLVSGETLATSHGKIMKLISDLKSLAYLDTVGVSNLDSTLLTAYNNRVTTDMVTTATSITNAGYVADARAVNNLQNQINTINTNIDDNIERRKLKIYYVTTKEELDDVLNNVNKRYSNLFYYQFLLSVNVSNLNLNGGTWLVEGYLAAEGRYGTQTIRLYSSKILDERHRSLRNDIWGDWCTTITNNNLYTLHTPIEGDIITNTVPSKVNTIVNSLTLEAGIYIVMATATYDSSFNGYLTNYYLMQDGKYMVTCRNSGNSGSGQCPCWIIRSTSSTTVSLGVYQGSDEIRTLNKNSLIATRLA